MSLFRFEHLPEQYAALGEMGEMAYSSGSCWPGRATHHAFPCLKLCTSATLQAPVESIPRAEYAVTFRLRLKILRRHRPVRGEGVLDPVRRAGTLAGILLAASISLGRVDYLPRRELARPEMMKERLVAAGHGIVAELEIE